jgi:flagellar hook protein FlgE
VTVDFGSAWPAAANDNVPDNWGPFGGPPPTTGPGKLMGVAQRDGLTGDATGYFDAAGTYIARSNAAITYQDGYAEGELLNLGVLSDGTIQGSFTNNQALALGKVAIATFSNPEGLAKVGGSHFASTANSGFGIMGRAENGGRGSVRGGFLEQSNVDLTEELTQMIVAQRGFEVNSRVISTANSLLNTLVQLGQ